MRWTKHRGRGLASVADEAVFATLHTISLASPPLREGLTGESARKALRHLRVLLGADAVAFTDTEVLLAWEGAGHEHSDSVTRHVQPVLTSGRPQVISEVACGDPGCQITSAVAAPLIIDGRVEGVIAMYGARISAAQVRAAGEVARWVSGQLELAELDSSRSRLMEAEMRALRAQISPHFVYNSLTTIASFVRTDPERARGLLLDFADFARHSFRNPRDFTTLADELRAIDRYLLLERARFGDRLHFSVEIAPEVLQVAVPFLSLQPLVENAIRHGMEPSTDSFKISIVARDCGAVAGISVEDNGVGMDPARVQAIFAGRTGAGEQGSATGAGIGLANVDERMRQVFGDECGLVVETAPGAGTKVSLRVPKYRPGVFPG